MATSRVTPVGAHLTEGFSTLVTFAADSDISFWERDVTVQGLDKGDYIDITTMHVTLYRLMAAPTLITVTDGSIEAFYDPVVTDQIIAMIGVETIITYNFSNSDTWDVAGSLKSWIPGPAVAGEAPTCTIEIVATNLVSGAETAPNYITAVGTD